MKVAVTSVLVVVILGSMARGQDPPEPPPANAASLWDAIFGNAGFELATTAWLLGRGELDALYACVPELW